MVIWYWICPSLGMSPSTTQLLNSTNTVIDNQDKDSLADDVDWISALSGCLIVLALAVTYSIYVTLRQRKERQQ